MKIIDLNKNIDNKYETAVALGNFDGIHIGHEYLIRDTVLKAKKQGLKPAVLLFRNHTKTQVKGSNSSIYILTSNEQKLQILKELGIEIVYIIDFDNSIMTLTSKDFVENIIIDKLNAKLVTVGFDYKFGYKALGDSNILKKLGQKQGFMVNIVDPIYLEDDIVSSTIIRNLIKEGNIKKANRFLGRNYTINGIVIKGENRGNKLGYPTANINPSNNYIIPREGVYETITIVNNKKYLGLTSVGYNLTFNGEDLKIENHILNFGSNIYNKIINIEFIDFVRENIKFKTCQKLIKQIENDIKYINKINK